jgi:hypothetical protein
LSRGRDLGPFLANGWLCETDGRAFGLRHYFKRTSIHGGLFFARVGMSGDTMLLEACTGVAGMTLGGTLRTGALLQLLFACGLGAGMSGAAGLGMRMSHMC